MATSKALKAFRKRLKRRGLKRVTVTVKNRHVPLLRDVAALLREKNRRNSEIIKAALHPP
jgi:hypothetical protein